MSVCLEVAVPTHGRYEDMLSQGAAALWIFSRNRMDPPCSDNRGIHLFRSKGSICICIRSGDSSKLPRNLSLDRGRMVAVGVLDIFFDAQREQYPQLACCTGYDNWKNGEDPDYLHVIVSSLVFKHTSSRQKRRRY
jgi:hypothetical protein